MRKVVINKCYGGFSFNDNFMEKYKLYKGVNEVFFSDIQRDDPVLVALLEEFMAKGWGYNGEYSALQIVEIPEDVDWVIQEYDGIEWIAENHRTWG